MLGRHLLEKLSGEEPALEKVKRISWVLAGREIGSSNGNLCADVAAGMIYSEKASIAVDSNTGVVYLVKVKAGPGCDIVLPNYGSYKGPDKESLVWTVNLGERKDISEKLNCLSQNQKEKVLEAVRGLPVELQPNDMAGLLISSPVLPNPGKAERFIDEQRRCG